MCLNLPQYVRVMLQCVYHTPICVEVDEISGEGRMRVLDVSQGAYPSQSAEYDDTPLTEIWMMAQGEATPVRSARNSIENN